MPVQLIACKRTTYADRELRPGDAFEASNKDAMILVAIGSAKHAEASEEFTLPAGVAPELDAELPKRQRRRQYRRRDMVAEGSHE